MKQIVFLLSLFVTLELTAQSSTRANIRDKLRIFYVVNGNQAPTVANNVQELNNAEIYQHQFNGAFWTNANLAGSQGMVKALLCEASNGGDANLQVWANRLLSISNKVVYVYIVDDSTNPITNWDFAWTNYQACQGSNGCWPCALGYASDPGRTDDVISRIAGQLTMGNYYFSRADEGGSTGINAFKKGVFLHELTHTQDNASNRSHIFHIGGRFYNYGQDGTHYYAEVLPNLAAGFKEALANFPQMAYNHYGAHSPYVVSYRTFETDGGLDIEEPPATGGASTGQVAFVRELIALGIPNTQVFYGTTRYYRFKYRDLPIKYIIRNEMVMGMIFWNCRFHLGADAFWQAIMSSNAQLYRVSSWPVDITFLELCRAARPAGMAETAAAMSVSRPGGNPYLFPLALCDFFTGFRATSATDFATIFENPRLLQPYIDAYWTLRPTVQTAVGASRAEASIATIKRTLGMN